MTNVVKFLSTRSFFQLGAELKREKYSPRNDRNTNQQLWIAFFITFVFFIWAVYALIKYQPVLPAWVIVLGILLLFAPAGPLLTLILVYYSVGSMKDGSSLADGVETDTVGEGGDTVGDSEGKKTELYVAVSPGASTGKSDEYAFPADRERRYHNHCPRHGY